MANIHLPFLRVHVGWVCWLRSSCDFAAKLSVSAAVSDDSTGTDGSTSKLTSLTAECLTSLPCVLCRAGYDLASSTENNPGERWWCGTYERMREQPKWKLWGLFKSDLGSDLLSLLLVTQTNSGTVWEGITQGRGYQMSRIIGGHLKGWLSQQPWRMFGSHILWMVLLESQMWALLSNAWRPFKVDFYGCKSMFMLLINERYIYFQSQETNVLGMG